jgi:hypothetical protein
MSAFASAFLAYCFLTYALTRGTSDDKGVILVLLSLGAALASQQCRPRRPVAGYLHVLLGLVASLEVVTAGGELFFHYVYLENTRRSLDPGRLGALGVVFRPNVSLFATLAALGTILTYGWRSVPLGRWRFAIILTTYAYAATTLLLYAPRPGIDVWHLQQQSCNVILLGKNPYAHEYPITAPFAKEVLKDGKVQSYPYPPLTLYLDLAGYLAGDVRWSLLAEILVAALWIVLAVRQLGLPAGHPAELAAVAFLWQPRGLSVLELAWTEPIAAFAAGFLIWSLAAGAKARVRAGLGLLLAAKQYAWIMVLPLLATRRLSRRDLLIGAAIALATLLPFLKEPKGLWLGLVTTHARAPFRNDSLAVPARVALRTGYQLPPALGLIAAGVAACLVYLKSNQSLSRAILGASAILLALFVFSWQAHANYYWLVGYLLAFAAGLALAEGELVYRLAPETEGIADDGKGAQAHGSTGPERAHEPQCGGG